jgi:hypothetical protein
MKPDTARFLASAAVVLSIVSIVLLAASGCRDFATYLVCFGVAVFAVFVALTQDA